MSFLELTLRRSPPLPPCFCRRRHERFAQAHVQETPLTPRRCPGRHTPVPNPGSRTRKRTERLPSAPREVTPGPPGGPPGMQAGRRAIGASSSLTPRDGNLLAHATPSRRLCKGADEGARTDQARGLTLPASCALDYRDPMRCRHLLPFATRARHGQHGHRMRSRGIASVRRLPTHRSLFRGPRPACTELPGRDGGLTHVTGAWTQVGTRCGPSVTCSAGSEGCM